MQRHQVRDDDEGDGEEENCGVHKELLSVDVREFERRVAGIYELDARDAASDAF
jgi:hypothetical protein